VTRPDEGPEPVLESVGAESMRELFERSFQRKAAELAARAREVDDRAAAHMQALDYDRATLPDELRRSIAAVLPGMVADAVRAAGSARPPDPPPREPGEREGPRLRGPHDPIVEARQRSFEKLLDALTRRAQEIDDRVTTRLRALDDDRAVLADVVRDQDRLARSLSEADVAGRHDRLAAWVTEAVPGMVAGAVRAAMEAEATALSESVDRVERVKADTEAMGGAIQESSERMLEALYRRDQEIDDRGAAHLRALEEERTALAALLEGSRDQVAQSVVGVLPAMVEGAVRTAMERYTTERRAPAQEMASRLRADSDVMRETLQRSFEKMMESLAVREQAMDERAAAHLRALEQEKSALAEIRAELAGSLEAALPGLVAVEVRSAVDAQMAEVNAGRSDAERLRAEAGATAEELREAIARLRTALVTRDQTVERQAVAHELALEGLRSDLAGLLAAPAGASAPPTAGPAPPVLVTAVVDETAAGRVGFGRPTVPRAQRVERRMLKIDDGDDGPWSALDRRQSALSELLDGQDG